MDDPGGWTAMWKTHPASAAWQKIPMRPKTAVDVLPGWVTDRADFYLAHLKLPAHKLEKTETKLRRKEKNVKNLDNVIHTVDKRFLLCINDS